MLRRGIPSLAIAGVIAWLASVASAGSAIRTERVRFEKGAHSAILEGTIEGDEIVDYLVGAAAGQQMNASLATKHGGTYFNLIAPGETDVAMFNGSAAENQYEGTLPKSGDYKVRVYMVRAAARRGETAKYRLEIIVTGAPAHTAAPTGDAKVSGTDFHATGSIPCSMGGEQPTGSCAFGVKRDGGGGGTVTVTKPDGRTRLIFFEKGRATGCDASQADPGEFSATREGDLTRVHIGAERYEIPDAVIDGG